MNVDRASAILWGKIYHSRLMPERHSFTYPAYFFALNLAELTSGLGLGRLFGFNRSALFSVWEKDYLGSEARSLKEKLRDHLGDTLEQKHEVILLTTPRFLGYVFNPVSYFLVVNQDGGVESALVEVNNTFGEKHLYNLSQGERVGGDDLVRAEGGGSTSDSASTFFRFPKEFYVSPFLPLKGDYRLVISDWGKKFQISIVLEQGGVEVFHAKLALAAGSMTGRRLLSTAFLFPFTALLVMTRIHLQALKLVFLKRAAIFLLPLPISKGTIRSRQNWVHDLRTRVLSLAKGALGR